jgi:hypothetical protein
MKNLHLIISIIIVIPVAFFYGSKPDYLFEVSLNSTDELNIFKAIMGLYLGFATLWIYGILKPAFWKTATISNMIFMLGLAFGRICSITVDGIPTTIFLLGTIGELILGIFAWYQLKKQKAFSS